MAPSIQNLGWFYKNEGVQQPAMQSLFLTGLTLLGAYIFTIWLISYIRFLLSLYVLPGKPLRSFGSPSKTWAVITGASDGLGKEYALALSKAGYSTLLISRTASKLDAVAQEIKQKFNTPTRTFAIDFARNSDDDYARLQDVVAGLDIAILINNVGVSHSIPIPFTETPEAEMNTIVMVNCMATLRITRLIAPGMVDRKRGLILTMGSFGGLIPTPLLATYSGSKAFLQQWSTALGAELAQHNVTVRLVQSYMITTAMSKIRVPTVFVPAPRPYVRSVLASIGRSGGAQGFMYSTTPWWGHAWMQYVTNSFVGAHNWILLRYNVWLHERIRRRALKKRAERKKGQ